MANAYEGISASAWEGVTDPKFGDAMPCNVCGNTSTEVLSMARMFARPHALNENTFMIPGRSWGYIQCDICEGHERERHQHPIRRWFRRLIRAA